MSDMINQRQDGRDDFVAAFTAGWHGKGTVIDRALTIDEALTELDPGQVIKVPVYGDVVGPDGLPFSVPFPGRQMTMRVRNGGQEVNPLGIVSDGYPVFDEYTSFRFLGELVNQNYATLSAMMLLDGGRRAAACLKLPSMLVGGFDEVERFVFCYTSHDGSLAYHAGETDIRVVCHNTATAALQGCERLYRLKHTAGAELDVAKAREVMERTAEYGQAFAAYADQMIQRKVTNEAFDRMVREMYGKQADRPGASKKAVTQFSKKLDLAFDLWNGRTVAGAGIGGTAWGAWNVFTEIEDWFTTIRSEDADNKVDQDGAEAMQQRWEANLVGENEAPKVKAQKLVMAMSA